MLRFDIKRASPFKDLFTIRDEVVKRICDNMRQFGFDSSKPLVLWKNRGNILIDGYTRLVAAELANIREIPVIEKEFDNEHDALDYAIDCQRNRRNLSEPEILKCISERDKRKIKSEAGKEGREKQLRQAPNGNCPDDGSKSNSESIFLNSGKTAEATANLLGISARKVERARSVLDKRKSKAEAGGMKRKKQAQRCTCFGRTSLKTASILGISGRKVEQARAVLDKAPDEIKEAVKSGKMSINKAYKKTMNAQKESPEALDKTKDETSNIKKVINIVKKRLSTEQIREMIKLLHEEGI